MSASASAPERAATVSPASLLAGLAAASVPRPPVKPLYQLSLALVTLFCVLVPLLYFALIGAVGWSLFHYYTEVVTQLQTRRGIALLLAWGVPGFIGGVVIAFMLKPLFAPRPKVPPPVELDPRKEREFVAGVHALCAAIGVRPPSAILVGSDVNAWVQFEDGWRGWLGGQRRLSIGLPLVAGMSARQLVGVLAHEFGHFAQGTGMRCAWLINSVNRWLESRAYHPDEWDERLQRWRAESGDLYTLLITGLASLCLWLIRLLMRGLFQLSFRASRRLSQEMEFDADRYEALVAGSDCFRTTALQLRALARAFREADDRNALAWREGKLAADLPAAVHARLQALDQGTWRALADELEYDAETRYWDSHPADHARIANAESLGARGLFLDERPAAALFADFAALSRQVTERYYRDMGLDYSPQQLVAADHVLDLHRLSPAAEAAWKRYGNGLVGELPMLDPADAGRAPWQALGWQECVDQLRQCSPDVALAWPRLQQRAARRRELALWVALLDHDIGFRLPSGAQPDGIALRTEYGQASAEDSPDLRTVGKALGLFARRLAHAVEALPDDVRPVAQQRLQLLQALHGLGARQCELADQREVVASLARNADGEGAILDAALERARRHREAMARWLEQAARVPLPETDGTLAQLLLERCPRLSQAGDDDIAYALALSPLEDALLHLYRTQLAELFVQADAVERGAGIRPIRLWQPAAEPA